MTTTFPHHELLQHRWKRKLVIDVERCVDDIMRRVDRGGGEVWSHPLFRMPAVLQAIAAGDVRPLPRLSQPPPLIAAITSTRELRAERRLEPGALLVHVDVDVRSQLGPGHAQPVAQAGPARVQLGDRAVHRRCLDLDVARQVAEERRQGRGEVDVGHGYASTATSTEEIAGR